MFSPTALVQGNPDRAKFAAENCGILKCQPYLESNHDPRWTHPILTEWQMSKLLAKLVHWQLGGAHLSWLKRSCQSLLLTHWSQWCPEIAQTWNASRDSINIQQLYWQLTKYHTICYSLFKPKYHCLCYGLLPVWSWIISRGWAHVASSLLIYSIRDFAPNSQQSISWASGGQYLWSHMTLLGH